MHARPSDRATARVPTLDPVMATDARSDRPDANTQSEPAQTHLELRSDLLRRLTASSAAEETRKRAREPQQLPPQQRAAQPRRAHEQRERLATAPSPVRATAAELQPRPQQHKPQQQQQQQQQQQRQQQPPQLERTSLAKRLAAAALATQLQPQRETAPQPPQPPPPPPQPQPRQERPEQLGRASLAHRIAASAMAPPPPPAPLRQPPAHPMSQRTSRPITGVPIAKGGQGFVPWKQYAASIGVAPGEGSGQRTLLLCPPVEPPPGWKPNVYGLTGEAKELAKRALEACRIAPAVPPARWAAILDEPEHELNSWPPARLLGEKLNAICAIAGHSRLESVRRNLYHLDILNQRAFGAQPLQVLASDMSVTKLKLYLQRRDEADRVRKQAANLRKDEGTATGNGSGESEPQESGAAAAAFSALKTASNGLMLGWNMDHPQLQQFSSRPPSREENATQPCEIAAVLHLELIAADERLGKYVRGSAGFAALDTHTCVRAALGKRCRRPRRSTHDMAIGAAGMDLKKGRWRTAGRPIICSVRGYSGSDAYFVQAAEALDADDFNARRCSLMRHHNGTGGDPAKATAWLDREPSDKEWDTTLAYLFRTPTHAATASGLHERVSPPLVPQPEQGGKLPTKHMLKTVKVSAYVACRVHTDYAVEAGAHAGSQLERMSVAGMHQQLNNMRPKGLATAMRYARAARGMAVIEIDHMVAAAVRLWVAQTGLKDMPRNGSWEAFASWVSNRVATGLLNEGEALLERSTTPTCEAPIGEREELIVGEDEPEVAAPAEDAAAAGETEIEVEAEFEETGEN